MRCCCVRGVFARSAVEVERLTRSSLPRRKGLGFAMNLLNSIAVLFFTLQPALLTQARTAREG